jgi:small subunit ribosomal protein S4
MRTVSVFVKGPGAGRESALRALRRRRPADQHDPRRHSDPAQRLPAAQAAPGLGAPMARYTGPVCRQCRREGTKLFLKGDRCFTEKCGVERRPIRRASTARAAARPDYGLQLREKQKVKRMYGVLEKQFRGYYYGRRHPHEGRHRREPAVAARAPARQRGVPLGFATSHAEARQLVRHGHFEVNGKQGQHPVASGEGRGRCACARSRGKIARITEALAKPWSGAACRAGSSSTRRTSRAW